MKLISMTDFVLQENNKFCELPYKELEKEYDYSITVIAKIRNYAEFLKQPLTLGMFVPCKLVDGVWVVLEEPKKEDFMTKPHGLYQTDYHTKAIKEYQEAKDRVLFKGFEFKGQSDFSFIFKYKGSFPTMIPNMNIELLANRYKDIELTPTAQKQIS